MQVFQILLQTAAAVALVIVLTRLNGLRSFSKMSSFDFALTVAAGSILATMMTADSAPWREAVALCALFVARYLISQARRRVGWIEALTDNKPLVVMYDGQMLEGNLQRGRISRDDLIAKLREANATRLSAVRAVVLEATGDISVLHGDGYDDALLQDVSWGVETRRTK